MATKKKDPKDTCYTLREAAEKLGVTRQSVYTWVKRGLIKAHQDDSNIWWVPKKTLKRPEMPDWHYCNPKNLKKTSKKKPTKKKASPKKKTAKK